MRKTKLLAVLCTLSTALLTACGEEKKTDAAGTTQAGQQQQQAPQQHDPSQNPCIQGQNVGQNGLPCNPNLPQVNNGYNYGNQYGQNQQNTPCIQGQNVGQNGQPCNPSLPTVQNPLPNTGNQTVPVGCYQVTTTVSPCSPCPTGYTQSGNQCVSAYVQTNVQPTCGNNMVWMGNSCMPQGFTGCPSGFNWNWQTGACACAYQQYLQLHQQQALMLEGWRQKLMWDAARQQYMMQLYYVANSPCMRCYYNGWGWNRF